MGTATPTLWFIAGPNGVGKTTYAFRQIRAVSGSVHFINLDEIARGLSPLDPEIARQSAARVALHRIREMIAAKASFSVETTLAGHAHFRTVAEAKQHGYSVNLLYFAVADVATCLTRIARRVSEGGHDVPADDVARRFDRGARELAAYIAIVDLWRVFDANGPKPRVVAEGRTGCLGMIDGIDGLPQEVRRSMSGLPPCGETL